MEQEFGLLEERQLNPHDQRAGVVSAVAKKILRESGSYHDVLPVAEYQRGVYFDTMACVTFSALNCLEILAKLKGLNWNKSDRFTAKQSGTSKTGNYFNVVADSIRNQGVVDEEAWPYPRTQIKPVFDWDDYYAPILLAVQTMGRDWLKGYEVEWEWQNTKKLREALKYGPVQVSVYAWPEPQADGKYADNGEVRRNHAVALVDATDDHYEIFDHYDKTTKYLVPDYRFGAALQFYLTPKNEIPMPTIQLPNNVLVQDVEDTGAFAMHLNGKLMVDDPGKVLATVLMRAPRVIVAGKSVVQFDAPVPLKKADWDSFPHINLKGESVQA
jgi:hypothetical protein